MAEQTFKMDFLRFSGDDPLSWVFRAEQYFDCQGIDGDDEKVRHATVYFEGAAVRWFRWLVSQQGLPDWATFVRELTTRFGPCPFPMNPSFTKQERMTTTTVVWAKPGAWALEAEESIALIEEYEKLRQPLSAAVNEELSLFKAREEAALAAASAAAATVGATSVAEEEEEEEAVVDRQPEITERSHSASGDLLDETVEDLRKLLYFETLFDVRLQTEFTPIMLTKAHERSSCLIYDYVTEDATDLLVERDLNLLSLRGSLIISRPSDSTVSLRDALQKAVAGVAANEAALADFPVLSMAAATMNSRKKKGQTLSLSEFNTGKTVAHGPKSVDPHRRRATHASWALGMGYDLTNDVWLAYCKGGGRLLGLHEARPPQKVRLPDGTVVDGAPGCVKVDKSERLRWQKICVGEWVKSGREQGKDIFTPLELNDGSCPTNLQVLVDVFVAYPVLLAVTPSHARLTGIEARVIKSLLEISSPHSWAEVLHSKLICVLINLLYQVPDDSNNVVSEVPFLSIEQVESLGGIEFVCMESSRANRVEEKRNLFAVFFDYILHKQSEIILSIGGSFDSNDESQHLTVMPHWVDTPEAFYMASTPGVDGIRGLLRRPITSAVSSYHIFGHLNAAMWENVTPEFASTIGMVTHLDGEFLDMMQTTEVFKSFESIPANAADSDINLGNQNMLNGIELIEDNENKQCSCVSDIESASMAAMLLSGHASVLLQVVTRTYTDLFYWSLIQLASAATDDITLGASVGSKRKGVLPRFASDIRAALGPSLAFKRSIECKKATRFCFMTEKVTPSREDRIISLFSSPTGHTSFVRSRDVRESHLSIELNSLNLRSHDLVLSESSINVVEVKG